MLFETPSLLMSFQWGEYVGIFMYYALELCACARAPFFNGLNADYESRQ